MKSLDQLVHIAVEDPSDIRALVLLIRALVLLE